MFGAELAFHLLPLYTTLTSALVLFSLWFLQKSIRPRKGDVQRPSTYAYGSVRQYPVATYYQIAQEALYLVYLRIHMFVLDGWRSPKHPLAVVPGIQLHSPRIVTSPLRAHGKALRLPFLGDWTKAKHEDELINAASFDYGGFGMTEDGAIEVLSATMSQIPHMDAKGTEIIERAACKEGASFLGYPFAQFASSGYTMNLVAFPALANAAASRGKKTVFLMDASNHNSMFVGSWVSRNVTISRFEHNNVEALERLLERYSPDKSHEIIVAIEGNYSMEGGLPPLPAIVHLKQRYQFKIYIDEAHSFLSIGNSGRGIVEHYQDLGYAISSKDVDSIGATLSKSAGTVGGIITSHDKHLDDHLIARLEEMRLTGGGGQLPTVVKVRLMQIWRKSLMVTSRMEVLRQHTVYILDALHQAGLCVHSDYLSPVIVVVAVSMNLAGKFGAECHRLGLAVTFAGPPATDVWRAVGRLCINALLSRQDVERLVQIVVQAAVNVGIIGEQALAKVAKQRYIMKAPSIKDESIAAQNKLVDAELYNLLASQIEANRRSSIRVALPAGLLEHGDKSLRKLGVGSSSVRQYWGTQLTHVACERRLANMYESLKLAMGNTGAIIMTDARNAIFSTLAACIGPHSKKSVINLVLLPRDGSVVLTEALMSMKKTPKVEVARYDDLSSVRATIEQARANKKKKFYVTLYLSSTDSEGVPIDLTSTLTSLQGTRLAGIQILLDDSHGFGTLGPRKLGYLDLMAAERGQDHLRGVLASLRCQVRFFLIGSLYNAFGLQGGFVVGERDIVKVLHWTSRSFLFSTAPLPSNIAMADRAIEALQKGEDLRGGVAIAPIVQHACKAEVEAPQTIEDIVELLAV